MQLYLETARGLFAREAGQVRLFVSSRSGGPLDDDDIVRIVAKAANRAGISKHVTPHTLRHACGTHLLKGRRHPPDPKAVGHRRHSRRHHASRILERLLIYMREAHSITDWRAVNESQLHDFALYAATHHRSPRGKRISAATLRQWLSIMRSFFVWLNRNGHLLHNPAERLAFPGQEQALPQVLNETELARLIETPDTTTAIGLRDRALLEIWYATGIRHAEVHKLDLYDVDTAAHRLTVRLGKSQRDRVVPLTEIAAHWVIR